MIANLNAAVATNSVRTWQINLDRIQAAIRLDPANPEYLATEAELYRYRAYMSKKGSESNGDSDPFLDANRKALEKYQHLLTLRPSWAPYWTSIIAIKYDLWEYDQLMIDALQNAARLAPWFKGNQHMIIKAGIHGWPYLDDETKAVVKQTIERAMLLQPKQTIKFAKEQGFEEWLQPYVGDGD